MQDFQLRVVAEKEELDSKIKALGDFFTSHIFKCVVEEEQVRLREQYDVMKQYSVILEERIKHFK